MKLNILVAVLCLIGASEFVTAMDYENSYLKFKLDNDLRIIGSKAHHMEFLVPPSEFTGKKITEAVPLHATYIEALRKGFEGARQDNETREVAYELEDTYFLAAITPKKDGFSVMVKYLVCNIQAAK